jgi:hypothetical protein
MLHTVVNGQPSHASVVDKECDVYHEIAMHACVHRLLQEDIDCFMLLVDLHAHVFPHTYGGQQ